MISKSLNAGTDLGRIYEIFVAGFPALTTAETIKKYFETYGPVLSVEILKAGKAKANARLPKVYCKLRTLSEPMFLKIIGHPGPCFKGRSLFCQEFKTGERLAAHSFNVNARRIVVKKVPRSLSLSDLKEGLEGIAGKIEVIYEYQSDLQIETANSKFLKTVSVTFAEHHNRLQEAINRTYLEVLPGITVEIEQFRYHKMRSKGDSTPPPKSLRPSIAEEIKTDNRVSSPIGDTTIRPKDGHVDVMCPSCGKDRQTKTQEQAIFEVMVQERSIFNPHVKPTQTKYHKFSHLKLQITDHCQTCGYFRSNLRFNLVRRSQDGQWMS